MRAIGLLVAILAAAALLWWVSGGQGSALDDSVSRPEANEQARERLPSAEMAVGADSARNQGTRTSAEVADHGSAALDDASPATDMRRLAGLVLEDGSLAPIVGFNVLIEDGATRELLQRWTTDSDGRFVTDPLPYRSVQVREDATPVDRGTARWILPGSVAMVPGAGPLAQTFTVREPAWVFEVDVVTADGKSAAGAAVYLRLLQRDPESGRDMQTGGTALTNEDGRARMGLWTDEGLSNANIFAARGDDEMSPVLDLGDPTEVGVPKLMLGAPCHLELEVSWSFGGTAAGRAVRVRGPASWSGASDFAWKREHVTDADGRCSIGPLLPGQHDVVVDNPRRGFFEAVQRDMELFAGETRHLTVSLGDGRRQLAVQGRVVDESGAALAGVDVVGLAGSQLGGAAVETETKGDGGFEIWAEPGGDVTVLLNHDTEGDVFEPGSVLVPFGTTDLLFRRVAVAEERGFRIVARDSTTGASIEGVIAAFDRGPDTESWTNAYAPRDLYRRRVQPGLRLRVGAAGYVSRILDLTTELARATDDPPTVRVDLRPGLSHVAIVRNMDTDEPLEGALFSGDGVTAVRTDADGRAFLESDRWVTYHVTHPDFEDAEWDPVDHVLFVWGPLHLESKD